MRHFKDHYGAKRRPSQTRSGVSILMKVIGFGFGAACLAFLLGFVSFLNEIHAAARLPPAPVDSIVVFSGEPHRIGVATNLLKNGFGQRLLIVGQDNGGEIEAMRSENQFLFECCVEIDNRSRNTAEDAFLARNLLLRTRSRSLILVTSSFHVPRAKKELRRLLPQMQITPYGVSAGFLEVQNILRDPNVGPAFLAQYLKFIAVSLPGKELIDKESGQRIVGFTSDIKNLVLLSVAVVALMVAAFAFSKNRTRHSSPLGERDLKENPRA